MKRRITATLLVMLASPAWAQGSQGIQGSAPQEGPITCGSPVAADDTQRSLKQRFGQDAVAQELPGAEGETYKGLVLFPKARDRRIEIAFTGDKGGRVSGLTLRDAGKMGRWTVAGIALGSSLADVQKANGKPFLVSGFEWDYGGFVIDWKGGALGRPMDGGCRLTIRFAGKAGAPRALSGDGVKVSSDNPALAKWAPVVTEIGVNFPDK